MSIIYAPKGRAGEYSELAANLYSGCSHGCVYCYVPNILRQERKEFYFEPKPRKNILKLLQKDCQKFYGEERSILLSFTSDPYQPIDKKYKITRYAIEIIKRYGLHVNILTKGGKRAERDFDLLDEKDKVGATLTFSEETDSLKWEPEASTPKERMEMLKKAKEHGFQTWVSLEPVIDPYQTLKLIDMTHEYVDHYKVGLLNYHPKSRQINWKKFANDVLEILTKHNKDYYIKNDLRMYLTKGGHD